MSIWTNLLTTKTGAQTNPRGACQRIAFVRSSKTLVESLWKSCAPLTNDPGLGWTMGHPARRTSWEERRQVGSTSTGTDNTVALWSNRPYLDHRISTRLFKMACNNHTVPKWSAMRLIPQFMCKTAAAILTARLLLDSKRSRQDTKRVMLTSYRQCPYQLTRTYTVGDVIEEADAYFPCYTQLTIFPLKLDEILCPKTLHCLLVYEK